ncbi:MAG TPA: hypothetical protein VFZ65_05485 [Planctomycetota bacterium]|nr:hypothetical protein [Planctomycetota bacterium]
MRRTTAARLATWFVIALPAMLASCGDTPPPAPATALDAATARQLLDRLDRLITVLEAPQHASAAPGPAAPAAAERTLIADPTPDLVARIDALERELAVTRSLGPAGFAGIPGSIPPLRAAAVQQFAAQLNGQDEVVQKEALRSAFLLTQQQVIDRFGMPSHVSLNNGVMAWEYVSGESSIYIRFVNGLAVKFD